MPKMTANHVQRLKTGMPIIKSANGGQKSRDARPKLRGNLGLKNAALSLLDRILLLSSLCN